VFVSEQFALFRNSAKTVSENYPRLCGQTPVSGYFLMNSRVFMTSVIMLVALSSIVSGCGRRGALEAPPNATVHDDWRKPDKKAVEEKPFILDKLI